MLVIFFFFWLSINKIKKKKTKYLLNFFFFEKIPLKSSKLDLHGDLEKSKQVLQLDELINNSGD